MKLLNSEPKDSLLEINEQFAAEQLRGMRLENTLRCILGYGWLAITGISIFAVLSIVVLLGLGLISLPIPIVLALIGGTVGNAWVLLNTIFKGVFFRRE